MEFNGSRVHSSDPAPDFALIVRIINPETALHVRLLPRDHLAPNEKDDQRQQQQAPQGFVHHGDARIHDGQGEVHRIARETIRTRADQCATGAIRANRRASLVKRSKRRQRQQQADGDHGSPERARDRAAKVFGWRPSAQRQPDSQSAQEHQRGRYANAGGIGLVWTHSYVFCSPLLMMLIAVAMKELASERVVGTMSVLPALARLPNCVMYCSATRSWTAWKPPGAPMASATRRIPSAVAVAIERIACAWPSASLICCWRTASEAFMDFCFSPSAVLTAASRTPSEVRITERFSRSALICFSMAARMSSGGVMFLIS